jgi:hypothetical protein
MTLEDRMTIQIISFEWAKIFNQPMALSKDDFAVSPWSRAILL